MQAARRREREAGALLVPLRAALPQVIARQKARDVRLSLADAVTSRRLFVLLPFAMIAGMIVYAGLPFEPEAWALASIGAAMLLGIVLLRQASMLPLFCGFAAAWLGFCLLPLHGAWFGTTMLARPAFGTYEARVDEVISATDEARRIVVTGITPVTGDRPVDIVKARLVVPPQPPLAPGDIIRGRIRLAPVPGPILPGAFDSQFHAYFAGIGAYGNVTSEFSLVSTGS
ncbi:MAG: hypothetical protein JWQ22_1339, partial [Devosia sp.]|nr:hypothetical protein [Devosia sp.]